MAAPPNYVLGFIGQSNNGLAADMDDTTSPANDSYVGSGGGEHTNIRIARSVASGQYSWRRLECWSPTATKLFGPEIAAAVDIASALTGDDVANLWIVQAAVSGTNLHTDWDPNALSGDMLWQDYVDFYAEQVALISASGKNPGAITNIGTVITNGEADGNNPTNAAAFEANMGGLIDAIRAEFPGGGPIVYGRLDSGQTAVVELSTVRTSQDNVDAEGRAGVTMLDTDAYGIQVDNLHRDANGNLSYGSAVALPIMSALGVTAPEPPADPWLSVTTGPELATAMGFSNAPTAMYRMDEASNASDLVGANNLTDVGTPTHEVSDTPLDTTVIGMTEGTTDGLDASTSSVFDVGAESVAVLVVGRMTGDNSTNRSLVGKKDGSGLGYEIMVNTDNEFLWFIEESGGTNRLLTVAFDHYDTTDADPFSVLAVNDADTDLCQIFSNLGVSSSDTALTATLGNSVTFSVGSGRLSAVDANIALVAIWVGADAEGLNNTHRAALHTFLGLA